MNRKEAYEQTVRRWQGICEGKSQVEECGFCKFVQGKSDSPFLTPEDCTKLCPLEPEGICGANGNKGLYSEWNYNKTITNALKVLEGVIRVGYPWSVEGDEPHRPEPRFKVGEMVKVVGKSAFTVSSVGWGSDCSPFSVTNHDHYHYWFEERGIIYDEEDIKPAPVWVDVTEECDLHIRKDAGAFFEVVIRHGNAVRLFYNGKDFGEWCTVDGKCRVRGEEACTNYRIEYNPSDTGFKILHLQEEAGSD